MLHENTKESANDARKMFLTDFIHMYSHYRTQNKIRINAIPAVILWFLIIGYKYQDTWENSLRDYYHTCFYFNDDNELTLKDGYFYDTNICHIDITEEEDEEAWSKDQDSIDFDDLYQCILELVTKSYDNISSTS